MFKCKYCDIKEYRTPSGIAKHEKHCRDNPNYVKKITKSHIFTAQQKEKMRLKALGRKHTVATKKKLSILAKKRNFGGITQSRWINYNGHVLGSTYELRVAISLDENNIRWTTCKKFNYIDTFGKSRTYTPDFYIIDYDIYLDPKNDFLINNINPALGVKDEEKIQRTCEQNNIIVLILNKNQLSWKEIKKILPRKH